MSTMRIAVLVAGVALAVAACERKPSGEWQEVGRRAANTRSTSAAAVRYDSAAYDTVAWQSSYARGERGSVVYDASCAGCHGADGRGGGPLLAAEDLEVGSLVDPEWVYRGDVPAIRRQIFIGHGVGMPSWGLTALSPRDVDAVAYFLDVRLPGRAAAVPDS